MIVHVLTVVFLLIDFLIFLLSISFQRGMWEVLSIEKGKCFPSYNINKYKYRDKYNTFILEIAGAE